MMRIALGEYGVSGPMDGGGCPDIVKYLYGIGQSKEAVAPFGWGSVFLSWCARLAGLPYNHSPDDRGWLDKGEPVHYDIIPPSAWPEYDGQAPLLGDVCVFWHGESPSSKIEGTGFLKGRAGLFIREHGTDLFVLCGNGGRGRVTGDGGVCILPYDKRRLLSIRRLESNKTEPSVD